MPGPAGVFFGGQITLSGSGFQDTTPDSTLSVSPLLDGQEVRGGIKIAGNDAAVADYLTDAGGKFTLRSLSSMVYNTQAGEFKLYDLGNANGEGWYPLRDYLGTINANIALQPPGAEDAPVTDATGEVSVPVVRPGVLSDGGLQVEFGSERGDITGNETFRFGLKNDGTSGLGGTYNMVADDSMAVPMWDADDHSFRPSPLVITSDGTLDTGTFTGDFTVTGNLTQGTNVEASSLDVTNQYIKSNDGNTQDPDGGTYNTAGAQGGFLVQYGKVPDTPDDPATEGVDESATGDYLQVGIFWDAGDSHWRKAHFTSSSSGDDAVYTEVENADGTPNIPILELADATNSYFAVSGDAFDYHYLTPATAFTYVEFGDNGSDFDIDTAGGVGISNQSMTLDGTAIQDAQGATVIANADSIDNGLSTFNKVRTARIMHIRAFVTDTQASTSKQLSIKVPDELGYTNIIMSSIYKIEVDGSGNITSRQEVFGAEFIPNLASDNIVNIKLAQAGITAGDAYDVCIVF